MTRATKVAPSAITVHVPIKLEMRGGRKTIIGEVPRLKRHVSPPKRDDAVIKAIARAYRWRSQIENGAYASITELATAQGVNQSYACRLLRLTLLAPQLIEDVLDRRISV